MMDEAGFRPDGHRARRAVRSRSVNGPVGQVPAESRQRRVLVTVIGLAALARYLGSRRFLSYVVTGAIGLAAAASLSRENQVRAAARMAAWDKQRRLLDQRKGVRKP
jgi:hypothetical protein